MRASRPACTWPPVTATSVSPCLIYAAEILQNLRLTRCTDIVKALITAFDSRPADEKKAYVDAGNEFGNTGLHWACLGGHLEAVKYLVSHGASPAVANDKDQIPLDSALFNDKREVADWFLAQSEKMEGGNQEEGLSGAASGIEIEDDGAVEEDKGKDKAGESSKSS